MFRPSRWFGWNRSSSADGVRSPPGRHNTPTIANVPNPHSLEHLKTLHAVMDENKVVSEENRTLLVETLRQIAEILIWGDQNDSTVFDFFLEKNMLYFFLQIMKQKCGGYVCTQLLQTLNILFENIRNETSLYYLLSNNHVNSIIVHKFDFDDEEVMAYYISFLKTLSLKLNNHTVHFFFNEHTADFPLYTEAIKFFNHSEKMVRIAVRTLTLNVFRVRENAMLRFIRDCTAAPYFSNLSWFIGKHVVDIEQSLASYIANRYNSTASAHSGQNLLIRLEDLIAEHLDHLHYLNDILLLNIDDLNSVLSDNLLHRLIVPLYLHSFLRLLHRRSHRPLKRLSQLDSTLPADSSTGEAQESTSLSPSVALFLLTQAYIIFSYRPLLNTLVNFLLRSNQVDIELNAKRCEFTPPEASLEQAIEQAISSSAIVASSSNPHSATSSPAHSTNAAGAQVQVQPDGEAAIASTANTTEVQTQLPYAQPASPVHGSPVPMEVDSAVLPGPVMTISNWPEYPFLIALLSALNSSITSSNGAAAAEAEPPTSTSRTTRSRENSSSESSSTNRAVGGSNPLSKSCHSPIVTRSIVELTNPDDRVILFTLSLITSILSNKAIDPANYRGVFVPPSADSSPSDSEATNSYCSALINSLLLIMRQCSTTNSSVRIVTFELAVYLFKRVVFYHHYLELSQSPCPKSLPIFLSDHQLAVLEQANEDAAHMLRTYFRSTDESVFLELFEQEAEIAAAAPSSDEREQLLQKRHDKIWSHNLHLNLEQLFMDSTLMLPPDEINPSAFDSNFYLRLPMNEYERTRYAIKVFFILRRLSEDVRVVSATEATENMLLPEKQADPLRVLLESTETTKIALDQFLDLENSDLNSCSIRFFYPLNQNRLNVDQRNRRNYSAPGSRTDSPSIVTTRKMSRFMVITAEHVILIEPDTKHYGWGVIRFIARLQDLEFWSHAHALNQPCTPAIRKEKDDVQSILVHFRRYQLSSSMMDSSHLRAPSGSIVVRFSFDDQIRCYAAKQHLTKAQSKVHDRKISAIVRLIDLNSFEGSSTRASDQPPPSAETSRATSAKSARANDARKKANQHQHPLLSRSLAVPGGAVLSTHTSPPPADVSGLNSALAKFEMLNKSKVAYPAAKAKSSKTTADGEVKRKKKLKNPNALLPEQEQDGIPLNDLSPKTVRRLVEHGEAKEATVTEHPLGESSSASEPLRSSQHRRNVTQTETIDI